MTITRPEDLVTNLYFGNGKLLLKADPVTNEVRIFAKKDEITSNYVDSTYINNKVGFVCLNFINKKSVQSLISVLRTIEERFIEKEKEERNRRIYKVV